MSVFFCAYCGTEIPADVIAKRHYSPAALSKIRAFYCNGEHRDLHRQATGGYKAMSLAGHDGRVAFLRRAKPKRPLSEETNKKISASLKRRHGNGRRDG